MAQTKRKRTTKHRGTAAGTVETRGRTSKRQSTDATKSPQGKDRAKPADRRLREPTWKSAAIRAALGGVVLILIGTLLMKMTVPQALTLAVPMFLIYVPLGYYMDRSIYRRMQRRAKRASNR